MRHVHAQHRAFVTPRAPPERVAARLRALFAKRPTDRVERRKPASLRYREEPPWFLGMAGAAFALLGALGAWTNAMMPHPAYRAYALSAVLEIAAGICLARMATALLSCIEFRAEAERIVLTRVVGERELMT